MLELIEANWPLVAIALVALVLLAWWIFAATRKTSVQVEVKPEGETAAKRNQSLIDAPPVAVTTPEAAPAVAPEAATIVAPVAEPAPPAPAANIPTSDDLSRIKGVGPKLVALLHSLGVTSFAQVAAWDEAEIDRIDAQLGRFTGRIRRDSWVEQARLLASGDLEAYEGKFGRT